MREVHWSTSPFHASIGTVGGGYLFGRVVDEVLLDNCLKKGHDRCRSWYPMSSITTGRTPSVYERVVHAFVQVATTNQASREWASDEKWVRVLRKAFPEEMKHSLSRPGLKDVSVFNTIMGKVKDRMRSDGEPDTSTADDRSGSDDNGGVDEVVGDTAATNGPKKTQGWTLPRAQGILPLFAAIACFLQSTDRGGYFQGSDEWHARLLYG